MSFEGHINSATAMRDRLAKARQSGVTDDATQRVSGEELDTFERGALAAVHEAFGKDSPEDRAWATVLAAKDRYVTEAITKAPPEKPPLAVYDGYIDYLNLAITTLNTFEAKSKAQPKGAWEYVTSGIRKLPVRARKVVLGIAVAVLVGVGGWNAAPDGVKDAIVATVYTPAPVLTVSVLVPERKESIARSFEIDETNSTHDLTDSNVKSYSRRFTADTGYAITKVELVHKSDNNVQNLRSNIDQGGASVLITFGLKAGPKTDRYRGWLRTTVHTTQERVVPAQTIDVVRAWPAKQGAAYTRPGALPGAATVEVRDDKGTLVATGPLGQALTVGKTSITVEATNAGLTVRAK